LWTRAAHRADPASHTDGKKNDLLRKRRERARGRGEPSLRCGCGSKQRLRASSFEGGGFWGKETVVLSQNKNLQGQPHQGKKTSKWLKEGEKKKTFQRNPAGKKEEKGKVFLGGNKRTTNSRPETSPLTVKREVVE